MDFVLLPAEGMDAKGAPVDTQFRRLRHLDLGDQIAGGGVRSGEVDAGRLADDTAPPVAANQISGSQGPSAGKRDVDPESILREARHFISAIDAHLKLAHPSRQDSFDMRLPQPEAVRVASGKVAD